LKIEKTNIVIGRLLLECNNLDKVEEIKEILYIFWKKKTRGKVMKELNRQ